MKDARMPLHLVVGGDDSGSSWPLGTRARCPRGGLEESGSPAPPRVSAAPAAQAVASMSSPRPGVLQWRMAVRFTAVKGHLVTFFHSRSIYDGVTVLRGGRPTGNRGGSAHGRRAEVVSTELGGAGRSEAAFECEDGL